MHADEGQIDIWGAVDAVQSSATAERKDAHGNVGGEGHSRRVVVVIEILVATFCSWYQKGAAVMAVPQLYEDVMMIDESI